MNLAAVLCLLRPLIRPAVLLSSEEDTKQCMLAKCTQAQSTLIGGPNGLLKFAQSDVSGELMKKA